MDANDIPRRGLLGFDTGIGLSGNVLLRFGLFLLQSVIPLKKQ
jgi:hypothetical protein